MRQIEGFDLSDIIDDALSRAGGEETTANDIIQARRSIALVLEDWATKGFNTWRVGRMTVGLSVNPYLTLPRDIDDILQVNTETSPGAVTDKVRESTMKRISATQYAQLTSKMTTGQPSQWYLERDPVPRLFVFPIGRPGLVERLFLTFVRRPKSFDRMSDDVDAPARWRRALIQGVAKDLASKRPIKGGRYNEDLITRLKAEYAEAVSDCMDNDRQRVNYRVRISA